MKVLEVAKLFLDQDGKAADPEQRYIVKKAI
jgi:hypothetical protein